MRAFIAELRRRHVIRTTTYYLGAAWVLIGACDIFFPMFAIAEDVLRFVIYAVLAGIPLVLVLSWYFEFSPEGDLLAVADSRGIISLITVSESGEAQGIQQLSMPWKIYP